MKQADGPTPLDERATAERISARREQLFSPYSKRMSRCFAQENCVCFCLFPCIGIEFLCVRLLFPHRSLATTAVNRYRDLPIETGHVVVFSCVYTVRGRVSVVGGNIWYSFTEPNARHWFVTLYRHDLVRPSCCMEGACLPVGLW